MGRDRRWRIRCRPESRFADIGSIQSYSSIDATINSGNNQTGLPATEGNIQSVQGWGGISGSITASNNISQIISAGAITATPTTGSGGVIGGIIANDKAITEAMVPVSDLNMAAFAAAMNELSYNLAAAAKQAGLAAGDISQAIASVQSLVSQEASQAQAGNRVALAAAQSQIAEASAAATTLLANAGQAVATAQSQDLGQINQAKTNAQTQDQQLNQRMLDELGGALQRVAAMAKQLSTGETALQTKIQTIQTNGQKAISDNIAALQKANSNRTSDWVKQANQDIANLLIKPLQTTINDVAMAAGFLALVPGLEPLMVVAGAASLLNAGISAMEGNYMSAGMYGVFALIPAGGKIADIGDMVQGAAPAVEDAVPAAQTAIEDAGQEEASTLEVDGVVDQIDRSAGFLGSPVVTAERLTQLGEQIGTRGIRLVTNGDAFLGEAGAAGAFSASTRTLYLGSDATEYVIAHELAHAE